MPMLSLVLLAFIASLFPQGDTGQLSGTVVDANGALITSANVKLISQSTSQVRELNTRVSGEFVFTLLPPGLYKLQVYATGFSQTQVNDIRVNITQTTSVVVSLDAAILENVVTVTGEVSLTQQESSQMGRVIEDQTLRQLPLPTRNFQQLLTLSPGTYASVSNNTDIGRGDSIISVNGQRTTSNNVRINGIDANAIGTNATPNIASPATQTATSTCHQRSDVSRLQAPGHE